MQEAVNVQAVRTPIGRHGGALSAVRHDGRGIGLASPRFSQGGTVTVGNSSGLNDGAAAVLLMSAEKARELGVKPLARVVGAGAGGVAPRTTGLGPVPATGKALERAGLKIGDIGLIELNEAFAVQSPAVMREAGFSARDHQRQRRGDRPGPPPRVLRSADRLHAARRDGAPRPRYTPAPSWFGDPLRGGRPGRGDRF